MDDERPFAQNQVLLAVFGGAAKAADIKGKLKAAERTAAIAELCGRGLLSAVQKGRSIELALTESGQVACTALHAEAPPPAPRKGAAPVGGSAVEERIGRMEEVLLSRIAGLEGKLDALLSLLTRAREHGPGGPAAGPAAEDGDRLRHAILSTVLDLDRRHRHGGLVPIPSLRRELQQQGIRAGDTDVNAALIALERDYVVDLLVAQSPTALPDRAAGIERPGRGLAYYVAPRTSQA